MVTVAPLRHRELLGAGGRIAHESIVRSCQLRSELAEAVEANTFNIHYQPVVNLATGVIVAGEALVRWDHPERGLLLPEEFIGIAESSGLIHELGRWILREACLAAVRWPAGADGRSRSLGVNVSPAQLLEPGFADVVAGILKESGLDPKHLTFEVTESALLDLEAGTAALQRISNLGVKLALDDFGIGYSALSYLADLPFDIVKVDQSFVSGMEDSERVEAMLGGILALCRSLGCSPSPRASRPRRSSRDCAGWAAPKARGSCSRTRCPWRRSKRCS